MTTSDIERPSADASADSVRPQRGLKVEAYVFFATAAFFIASTLVYGFWSKEPAGIVGCC